MDKELLVKSVRELCKKNNITPSQLENELNFGAGLISRWTKSSPSFDKIVDIADYFNVSLDEVAGRNREDNENSEFIDRLRELTNSKIIKWNDYKNTLEFENKDYSEMFGIYSDLFEIYYAKYNNSLLFVISQYEEEYGKMIEIDCSLYIQPDESSSPVLEIFDEEYLEDFWLYIHTILCGTTDEYKANEIKKNILNNKNNQHNPIEKYRDNPEIVKQIYEELVNLNPQILEIIDRLNTPEFQKLQKTICSKEFNEFITFSNVFYNYLNKKCILEDIDTNKILYIEQNTEQCAIHLEDGSIKKIDATLDKLYEELKDKKFIRIHNMIIINANKILEVKNNTVIMINKKELPISKKIHREDIIRQMKDIT